MTRDTSAVAYREIQDEGVLGRMQKLVYEWLQSHPRITGSELNRDLQEIYGGRENYHKRLSELEQMGVVMRVGKRSCTVTGRMVHEWMVGDGRAQKKRKQQKPDMSDIRDAVSDMKTLYHVARRKGVTLSAGYERVWKWLERQSRKNA